MKFETIPKVLLNDSDTSPTESTLIHSYPGSMPAYLASRLTERYSNSEDSILDPFCGSGSVIIEAAKLHRKVIGVDLLDTANSITEAAFYLPDPESILECWKDIQKNSLKQTSIFSDAGYFDSGISSSHKLLIPWFHKETFVEIICLYKEIKTVGDERIRKLFGLILSSCLISLSNRVGKGVLHWGWIADNVKPKSLGLLKTDAFHEMDKRILRLIDFMKATNGYSLLSKSKFKIINHDWLSKDLPVDLAENSIDLLITSPPYPYSIDYTLALRLTHYLFEMPFDDIRKNEIGARYKRKRSDREKQYLDELGYSLNQASKAVKDGGKAVYVLPHPDEYRSVVDMSIDQWIEFLKMKMHKDWSLVEIGFRDCIQRRVVHKSKATRQEFVAAFIKE